VVSRGPVRAAETFHAARSERVLVALSAKMARRSGAVPWGTRRIGAMAHRRDRTIARLGWRIACTRRAAMRKQHRIPILIALAIAASSGACKGVRVQGVVLDEDTFGGVPGAIVTYTNVNTGVTYNDTSLDPSGAYMIDLSEDDYIIQVVAAGCGSPPAVQQPLLREFTPYTINLFVDCP
jgi:hypothetical protein